MTHIDTANMEPECAYLRAVIEPLVSVPESFLIERTLDERGILLTVSVDKTDMGRVLGRQGETARAIRRLLRQFGMTNKAHIALKFNEPEGSEYAQ